MLKDWFSRSPIVANLFNPAFCGEVIYRVIKSFNSQNEGKFSFEFCFLILPILLHKDTREKMPRTTRTYLFQWIEENEALFYDFSIRAKEMVPFTKESIMFLLQNELIEIKDNGQIEVQDCKLKKMKGDDLFEYNEIIKKAEMFGKWLSHNNNVNTVYSFLRLTP